MRFYGDISEKLLRFLTNWIKKGILINKFLKKKKKNI